MTVTLLEHVPVGKIKPDPDQPRKTRSEDEQASLVASVKQHGILTPLTLRRNGGDGYVIVAGERRWRAAKEAKLATVPAQIVDTDGHAVAALVENLVRDDLNPVEEGDAYARLVAAGMTAEQIAEQVSRPKARVEDRLELAAMPQVAREALIAGRCTQDQAHHYAEVTRQDAALGAAICTAADMAGGWHNDPWAVFFNMDRLDRSMREVSCAECGGDGYDEQTDEDCAACGGEGTIKTKVDEPVGWPPFFAYAIWHSTPLVDMMIEQLTDAARERITAATAKLTAAHAERKAKGGAYSYLPEPPTPSLEGQEIMDAAVAAHVVVEFDARRRVIFDPAFVSEYLPEVWEQEVDDYVTPPKRGGAAKESGKKLTAKEQKEKDERAKARTEAAGQRAAGRELNARLGVAIQTKLGEVKVTTDAMKLLVATILDLTKTNDYRGLSDGHGLYQRHTRTDFPATKAGDFKVPRSREDRTAFLAEVYAQADRELAAAKNADQAFAVLVRFLAHGLVDLRGLPKADLEGLFDFGTQKERWRAFVLGKLPKALRDRVPEANGVPGSSHSW